MVRENSGASSAARSRVNSFAFAREVGHIGGMRRKIVLVGLGIAVACKSPDRATTEDAALVATASALSPGAPAPPRAARDASPASLDAPDAASPANAPDASADASLPAVNVANIGMHIGGGPNDAATKEPIAKSVEPHFDELRLCFAHVTNPKSSGDFGIDLKVPANGGKAQVTAPRTVLKGDGFTPCVVAVFEGIEFLKPRFGVTVVSYSVRFTPQ